MEEKGAVPSPKSKPAAPDASLTVQKGPLTGAELHNLQSYFTKEKNVVVFTNWDINPENNDNTMQIAYHTAMKAAKNNPNLVVLVVSSIENLTLQLSSLKTNGNAIKNLFIASHGYTDNNSFKIGGDKNQTNYTFAKNVEQDKKNWTQIGKMMDDDGLVVILSCSSGKVNSDNKMLIQYISEYTNKYVLANVNLCYPFFFFKSVPPEESPKDGTKGYYGVWSIAYQKGSKVRYTPPISIDRNGEVMFNSQYLKNGY